MPKSITLTAFIQEHTAQNNLGGLNHCLEDMDFYKLTMGQVYDALLPHVSMQMKFHNRTAGVNLAKYEDQLGVGLDHLCNSRVQVPTLDKLATLPYFSSSYLEFLRLLQLNRRAIQVRPQGEELDIRSFGAARFSSHFETHVMAIVQEAYFTDVHADLDMSEGIRRLEDKLARFKDLSTRFKFTFSEFGTRRRACFAWQHHVVKRLIETFEGRFDCFIGTSNVLLATLLKTPLAGTMAHEFLQVGQGLNNVSLENSQKHMLNLWQQFYRGRTGIALSDVVGNLAFLRDFDHLLANSFIGVRHDSGDPFTWAERQIQHYVKLGIDPRTKVLMFSDGLNFDLCERLLVQFHGHAKLSFGIGTDWTNDLGVRALQLVMKAVTVNDKPVAKISDSAGKGMCENPAHEAAVRAAYMIGDHFDNARHASILDGMYVR